MTKIYRLFLMAFVAAFLISCDGSADVQEVDMDDMFNADVVDGGDANVDAMEVKSVKFSPNHKKFSILTSLVRDMGPYPMTDTSLVVVKASEMIAGYLNETWSKPQLVAVKNTEGEEVFKLGIKVLVLVDLAQPQYVINRECDAVREIRAVFDHNNLFVAFMYGQNVSETMEASDYVLNTYFTSKPDQYKYLYRAILLKKHEMEDRLGVWGDAKSMGLMVFSNEVVYADDDCPIDPQHFELQGILVNPDSVGGDHLSIFPVNFRERNAPLDDSQAKSVLQVVAKNSDGMYQSQFNWQEMKGKVLKTDKDIIANEFDFENPDGKIYRGLPHRMRIEVYSKVNDSLVGAATTSIYMGTAYNPVIVSGYSDLVVFLQGVSFGLVIMLIVYLVFQFLVPYIQYRIFKRKYVVEYVRGSMSVGNIMVSQSCYLCKAPFEEGEEIVVKCNHVMHKSCWDENNYHCPEFGRHCDSGSHYYNYHNLFDPKNASFYMKWILVAILAGVVSWVCYMLYVSDYDSQQQELIARMAEPRLGDMGALAIFNDADDNMDYTPVFGLFLGFFVTMAISSLAVRRQHLRYRMADVFIRSLIVGVLSFFVFFIFKYFTLSLNLPIISSLLDLIPWTLSSLMIVFISTVGTRIRLKKYVFGIAVGVGVLSMYLWSFIIDDVTQFDIRVLLMFTFILVSIGLALSVAEVAPKSERYFLNIKGAVKEMDVALFKWFLNDPDMVVTIGKSIDCSLQLSWDLKGNVAPVHAQLVRTSGGTVRLTALEEGVMVKDKPLAVGKTMNLYHNSSFTIGDTTFTYIERDI